MNNDLISRSKLEKAIKDKYSYASATGFLLTMKNVLPQDVVYQILTIIDNAPSVEYPFYAEAYQTGYEEGKNERTQGEWVYHSDGYISFYTCNKCNGFGYADDNFCNNCGAKMKGGVENE